MAASLSSLHTDRDNNAAGLGTMDAKHIKDAQETVGWLADLAMRLPPDSRSGGDMALHLRVAQLYLAEYAGHLEEGLSPYHALVATARPNQMNGD